MTGQCGRPKVGIVSDVVLQRHRLQAATSKFGLEVRFSGDPDRLLGYPEFPDASLWLVTLEDEADHPLLFDHLLENTEAPVLFGLDEAPKPGSTEYFRWERRLLGKLEHGFFFRSLPVQEFFFQVNPSAGIFFQTNIAFLNSEILTHYLDSFVLYKLFYTHNRSKDTGHFNAKSFRKCRHSEIGGSHLEWTASLCIFSVPALWNSSPTAHHNDAILHSPMKTILCGS